MQVHYSYYFVTDTIVPVRLAHFTKRNQCLANNKRSSNMRLSQLVKMLRMRMPCLTVQDYQSQKKKKKKMEKQKEKEKKNRNEGTNRTYGSQQRKEDRGNKM
eukprot:TRINITY_DN3887_c0_g1_i2.p5 TRINITY_DN3887_c0_g1~~TRINITY_DN3887_c0_g1_i2.p5  ORF type:complete len:102 (+),score=4.48 TRINITY_DN3887_c0_g1_i2:247-552(+)